MAAKVLIFGTGSIGCMYAYILSKAIGDSNIVCICRSNYTAAKQNGLTINSTIFGQNLKTHPHIVSGTLEALEQNLGPFTHIIICAKAIQTKPSIPDQIKPLVDQNPSCSIVLIQNGIDIEKTYRATFPQTPILSCVVYLPATQISPAIVAHKEVEHLHIGTYPISQSTTSPSSTSPNTLQIHQTVAETFASLIHRGGGTATVHDDIQVQRWTKLLVNAAWNPICALSRCCDAEFLTSSSQPHSSPSTTSSSPTSQSNGADLAPPIEYIRAVMHEIALVAQARGYEMIDSDLIDYQIGRASIRALPGVEPSMLADIKGGRLMEVEAILGNVLQIARDEGIGLQRTPLLWSLYVLLRGLDWRTAKGE